MAHTTIETVAYIVKEERITTIEHNIRPGTFVVEPREPYPGYHGLNTPEEVQHNPTDIFLLTKKRNAAEQIAHLTRKVITNCGIEFNAARSELFFYNDTYPGIRIRGLESYAQIEILQTWYADLGINFLKKEKIDTKAIIKIQKMLTAEELQPGVWQDLLNAEMRYFEIPKEISFQQFAQITTKIKNNQINNNFDVALGGIFRMNGLVDIIRVYSNSTETLENTKNIRNLFVSEIEKL
jgi:hypothetical protein